MEKIIVPNVLHEEDYEKAFVEFMGLCILKCKIDPEEVPQLMERVYVDEFGLNP